MNLREIFLATIREGQMLDEVKQIFEYQYPVNPDTNLVSLAEWKSARSQRWHAVRVRFTQALNSGNLLSITPEEIVTGRSHTDQEEKQ